MTHPLFSFDTTHMALWAEEVARSEGIPADVVPAPPELEALCGLALVTLASRAQELVRALEAHGVEFYPPRDLPGSSA
ncbi:MAG: DUF3343 domain-containing protein [Gemmatimonadota bacterium]